MLLNIELQYDVIADSPTFIRQVITDPSNDWFIVQDNANFTSLTTSNGTNLPLKIAKNITECTDGANNFHLPDIVALTYYSDGNVLNATMWLSSPFKEPPSNASANLSNTLVNVPWFKIRYGITISTPSIYDSTGSDYQTKIIWDLDTKTWTKTVDELSPSGEIKSLNTANNYSQFFDRGKGHIDLPLELNALNFPSQYSIFFYISDVFIKGSSLCQLVDISNRVHIPPPEFIVRPSHSSVTLRPGEEKNVEVQVKSNTKFNSYLYLSTDEPEAVKLRFIPNQTAMPPLSVITSELKIKALDNSTARPYTLPIRANISFPTEIQLPRSSGEIMNNSVPLSINQNSNLTVTILEPLSLSEYLNNFYNAWLTPISGIWTFAAGAAAVIGPLIIRMYNKKKGSHKRITDWFSDRN